eukprot:EG_transcript_3508
MAKEVAAADVRAEAGGEGSDRARQGPAEVEALAAALQGLQLDTAGDGGREEAEEVATTEPVSEVAEEANKQALRELFHYDIVRKIDDGSYGEVFEAEDLRSGDRVAIKRIGMETQHTLPQDVVREIASLTRLRTHPLVVTLKEVFVHRDDIHLVLSYHETTLHDLADDLALEDVRLYAFQLLLAVDDLWRLGILHRDLKPQNILVGRHKILRLADFGHSNCSRRLSSDHVGTRDYRAPELLFGCDEYDVRAEVWAVACTLYFLHTGSHLFDSKDEPELVALWLRCFAFPTTEEWPALATARRYGRYAAALQRPPPRPPLNALARLVANKSKPGKWTKDLDLLQFTALLSSMLAPNPTHRPMPRPLLRHDFFLTVWAEFEEPDMGKTLQLMWRAVQWNRDADLNLDNVDSMPGYPDGGPGAAHFPALREAFQAVARTAQAKFPLALEALLDGLDVVDHLAAAAPATLERLLQQFSDAAVPTHAYHTVVFSCVFLAFKYYDDLYHDLALPESETPSESDGSGGKTAAARGPDTAPTPPGDSNAGRWVDGAATVADVDISVTTEADDGGGAALTAEPEPGGTSCITGLTVPASPDCHSSATSISGTDSDDTSGSEDDDDEDWETGSTVTSSSASSDSSGRSGPRQVGRVDDISDALGVRLRDVLACERAVLETVGLAFLNRPTLHRQLLALAPSPDPPAGWLPAAQFLGLLALQDPGIAAYGLRRTALGVAAALKGVPLVGPAAVLLTLFQSQVLPTSLLSPPALDLLAARLNCVAVTLPDRPDGAQ